MLIARPTWSRIGGVLVSIVLATSPLTPSLAYAAASVDKSQTVHVQMDPAGEVTQVKVENLLANDAAKEQLTDKSELANIKPSDDEQSFAQGSDNAIVWTTNGKQVNYSGTSSQQPPVRVKVSYTLDGKPVQPEQLAGKDGRLVMRIDYENTSSSERTVGEKTRNVYTPFMCMTAAVLDSDVFHNVQVENGKLIDDKGGLAVIGYALPGLKASLDTGDDIDLDLPEFVQITADVSNFALDPVYTIVTPELFGELDSSDLDLGLDDMDEGSSELKDAMGQLIDGSNALGDALRQLTSGTSQIGSGLAEFKQKTSALPDGMTALSTHMKSLSEGLGTARDAAGQLADGAAGLVDLSAGAQEGVCAASESVGAANGSVTSLKEKAEALNLAATKKSLEEAATAAGNAQGAATQIQTLTEGLDDASANQQEAQAAIDAAAEQLDALATSEGLTQEQLDALQAAQAALQQASEQLGEASLPATEDLATQTQILASSSETLGTKATEVDATAKALDPVVTGAADALDHLGAASGALDASAQSLTSLNGAASTISGGISGLSGSLGTAATGADTLATQLSALSGIAPQMVEGVDALNAGIGQLAEGLKATAEGSDQLTSGLSTFDNEGIQKIIEAFDELDGDMGQVKDEINSLRDAANDYDTFDVKADGQTSSVRFIYKTDQIG